MLLRHVNEIRTLPPGSVLQADPATVQQLQHRYLEALVQWEFKDPTLRLAGQP